MKSKSSDLEDLRRVTVFEAPTKFFVFVVLLASFDLCIRWLSGSLDDPGNALDKVV